MEPEANRYHNHTSHYNTTSNDRSSQSRASVESKRYDEYHIKVKRCDNSIQLTLHLSPPVAEGNEESVVTSHHKGRNFLMMLTLTMPLFATLVTNKLCPSLTWPV